MVGNGETEGACVGVFDGESVQSGFEMNSSMMELLLHVSMKGLWIQLSLAS